MLLVAKQSPSNFRPQTVLECLEWSQTVFSWAQMQGVIDHWFFFVPDGPGQDLGEI